MGQKGDQGNNGYDGLSGRPGAKGDPGKPGKDGESGLEGPPGAPGVRQTYFNISCRTCHSFFCDNYKMFCRADQRVGRLDLKVHEGSPDHQDHQAWTELTGRQVNQDLRVRWVV